MPECRLAGGRRLQYVELSKHIDFADQTVAWCGSELYLSRLVTHVGGNSGVMLIQYLSGDAADRLPVFAARVASDFSDFSPRVFGVLLDVDVSQPLRIMACYQCYLSASASASSIRPARISLFLRRSIALAAGVM